MTLPPYPSSLSLIFSRSIAEDNGGTEGMRGGEKTRETSSSSPRRPPQSSPRSSSPEHYRECRCCCCRSRHSQRRRRRDRRMGSGSGTTTPTTTGPRPAPPPAIAPQPERRVRDVAVRCPGGEGGKERECRLRRRRRCLREQRRRWEEEGGNDGGGANDRGAEARRRAAADRRRPGEGRASTDCLPLLLHFWRRARVALTYPISGGGCSGLYLHDNQTNRIGKPRSNIPLNIIMMILFPEINYGEMNEKSRAGGVLLCSISVTHGMGLKYPYMPVEPSMCSFTSVLLTSHE